MEPGMTANEDEFDFSPSLSFDELGYGADFQWSVNPGEGTGARSISSLDSSYKLISLSKSTTSDPGTPGEVFLLKTPQDAKAVPITDLLGFMPLAEVDYYESFLCANNSPFIVDTTSRRLFCAITWAAPTASKSGASTWSQKNGPS
jgi:hypothetical protein